MDVLTERLIARPVTGVSGLDNITVNTQVGVTSAFLGTMRDFMYAQMNKITLASTTISTGASAQTVTVNIPVSGIMGHVMGIPFYISSVSADGISGTVLSSVSTTSAQIRKVLVGLAFSVPAGISSIAIGSATTSGFLGVVFVYGSAFATSANAVTSGGQSAYFNSVPLPKGSGGMVPVGWLNIPNSFPVSTAISSSMCLSDFRELQGIDFTLFGTVQQP